MDETVEIDGETYRVIIFSNIVDETMCLELWNSKDKMVACIDRHDEDGRMTFDSLIQELPLTVFEWMIESAKKRLPPVSS